MLASGDAIRKRTSAARGKLTGMRFYTFGKRWLAQLLPELLKAGGDALQVSFDAAYRDRRGRLRGNS
ncbi:hypothetical protein [Sinimarinibacterium thermocellulolyticum]|uniref:Uncharacterized protein n=1 Tax=Sinimarinibacterium thermocellulolyticum TaxID=3170016 RepID=A0ABV2A6B2_9GAMM